MRSRLSRVLLVVVPLFACGQQRASLVQPSPSTAMCSEPGAGSRMPSNCGHTTQSGPHATSTGSVAGGSGAPSVGKAFLIGLTIGLIVMVVTLVGGKGSGQ